MSIRDALFRPAEELLGRLTLPGKILLLGVAFLSVVALTLTLFWSQKLAVVATIEHERGGVAAIRPIANVMHALQVHRGLRARMLSGDTSASGAVDSARVQADEVIASAEQALREPLSILGLEEHWRDIHARWQGLRHSVGATTEVDFDVHVQLIADLMSLVSRVADASGLTLDSRIDTYYMMDAVVLRFPAVAEAAAQARGIAGSIAARGIINLQERVELASRHANYTDDLAALAAGLAKAGEAPADTQASLSAGDAFGRMVLDEFVSASAVTTHPAAAFAAGTNAVDSAFSQWRRTLDRLDRTLRERAADQRAELWVVGPVTALLLALAAYLVLALKRSVSRAATEIAGAAQRIAKGDLSTEVRCAASDEFGSIAGSINEMRLELARQLSKERSFAVENLRIRNALDKASVSLMLADADGCIIYMNDSVARLLRSAEAVLRESVPGFSVDSLIGSNIDDFHRNPGHQRAILRELRSTHRAQIEVGGFTFLLNASPVIDDDGNRHGTVLEWTDRTSEVQVEGELSALVTAALAGDFDQRLQLQGKDGFFRHLAEGMNRLLELTAGAIDDVGAVLNAMARGDLTRKIEKPYEGALGRLRDDTNITVDRLRQVVGQIQDASAAINSAAQEIAAGNTDLSVRTEVQASSLEETSTSMEQISATVRQNADNAREANELARKSNVVAERGGEMMGRVVTKMKAIQAATRKIDDIIGVIDSIAFQTNILALNAAVEAARAGEQGRGFAVVATEVRGLAQRSAHAAKEVKALIGDSSDQVEGGAALVAEAGETMQDIVENFRQVAVLVGEIASASKEQSAGVDQVSDAVSQMDEVTQHNAALVEQAAAAAGSLQEQASALVETVATLSLTSSGRASGPTGVPDLQREIARHMQFKGRLRNLLAGTGETLDAARIEHDGSCELGAWLRGADEGLRRQPQYAKLVQSHEDFHRCAAQVIRLHDAGNADEARLLLCGEFTKLANETVQGIDALGGTPAVQLARTVTGPAATSVVRPFASPLPKVRRGNAAAALHDEWEQF